MPQPGIGAGKPQPAFAIFMRTGPVRLDQAPLLHAVQRHVAHGATADAAQSVHRIQPIAAVGRELQHVEHILLANPQPGRTFETPIGLAYHQPGIGGHPQPFLAIHLQPVDAVRRQYVRADALEAVAGPACQAPLGAYPQAAIGHRHQIGHGRCRQAVGIALHRHEAMDDTVRIQPVQAGGGGAKPHASIGRGSDCPDRVAVDLREMLSVVEAEAAAVGAQHHQPGTLCTNPQPVGCIHMQAPDLVVAQPILGTPDAVVASIETGQAVTTAQPQVTGLVFGKGVDVARRQTIGHGELARLRRRRHFGPRTLREQQQAGQCAADNPLDQTSLPCKLVSDAAARAWALRLRVSMWAMAFINSRPVNGLRRKPSMPASIAKRSASASERAVTAISGNAWP
ncbi:hypothetical protein D3C81_1265420 [compost metagenome]